MKSKRTLTEKIYLFWHLSYGMILALCFFTALFGGDLIYLVAYGLIPQGIFQLIFGFIALLEPKTFRLKSRQLLFIWLFFSLVVLWSFAIPLLLDHAMYFILIVTPALPVLQFYSLYSKKFKH